MSSRAHRPLPQPRSTTRPFLIPLRRRISSTPGAAPRAKPPKPTSWMCARSTPYRSGRMAPSEAKHLDQVFELPQRLLVEGRGGKADVRGGDYPAELEDLLPDTDAPDAELGFEADQGEVAEEVLLGISPLSLD